MDSLYHDDMRLLKKIWEFFLDILFPLEVTVLEIETMPVSEFTQRAKTLHVDREIPESIILFEYKDPLIRTAIAEVKFRGNKKIAGTLGEILRDNLIAELSELHTFENFSKPILTAVPMTKKSLRKRGWDQCRLMLSTPTRDAKYTGIEVRYEALRKIRETDDQVGKNKSERLENLTGCIEAEESIVRGRNIIVFDDVVTTGATWIETKRALRKAGARKVILLALAH